MRPVHPWPPSWSITASAGLGLFLCLVRWGRDTFSSGGNGPVSNLPVCYPRVPRPSFSAGPVRAAGPRFVGRLEPIRIRGQDSCFCVIQRHDRGRDKHIVIKIAEHPLDASRLGTIDPDDAEVLRPHQVVAKNGPAYPFLCRTRRPPHPVARSFSTMAALMLRTCVRR
jgi:hypothetical protein